MSWTRGELKNRAKLTLKTFYWKMVLVALILSFVTGGGGTGISGSGTRSSGKAVKNSVFGDGSDTLPKISMGVAMAVLMIVLVVMVIALMIRIFLLNVLTVGCRGFFSQSMTGEPDLGTLGNGFTRNYWKCVKTCFLRDLFVGLWSLLFFFPGLVKSYEYRMVPYLLAEHPEMDSSEVLAQSKAMMYGNKWDVFLLDVSFIGWTLLGALTAGLVYIFWAGPYIYATDAALYHRLSGLDAYGNGGYGPGGYSQGTYGNGGYDQGGYSQGTYGNGGYDQGGYSQGTYGNGGYDQGGYSQGTYGNGGYDQGGYSQGTYGNGGYDQGDHGQTDNTNSGYDQDYFSDN